MQSHLAPETESCSSIWNLLICGTCGVGMRGCPTNTTPNKGKQGGVWVGAQYRVYRFRQLSPNL